MADVRQPNFVSAIKIYAVSRPYFSPGFSISPDTAAGGAILAIATVGITIIAIAQAVSLITVVVIIHLV